MIMSLCYLCGKALPGEYIPAEVVICRDCANMVKRFPSRFYLEPNLTGDKKYDENKNTINSDYLDNVTNNPLFM